MTKKKISTEFIFKKVSIDMFHGGLMAKLGSNNLQTLLALATFMDKDGICYPSQDLLAKGLGLSSRTKANDRIKKLLAFKFNGQAIVTLVGKRGMNNIYKISPLSQITVFETEPTKLPRTIFLNRTQEIVADEGNNDITYAESCVCDVPVTGANVTVEGTYVTNEGNRNVTDDGTLIRINESESFNKNQNENAKNFSFSNKDMNSIDRSVIEKHEVEKNVSVKENDKGDPTIPNINVRKEKEEETPQCSSLSDVYIPPYSSEIRKTIVYFCNAYYAKYGEVYEPTQNDVIAAEFRLPCADREKMNGLIDAAIARRDKPFKFQEIKR